MDLSKLYLDNNFELPIRNIELNNIFTDYIKNAKGAGRHRTGGLKMLYYEITINNINLPGQRPFYTRMNDIVNNDLKGKRLLDIGSNIGLIGIFLIYYHGVSHVTFVEHDIECCRIINQLAGLLKISDRVKVVNGDLNKIDLHKDLGYNYDFVNMLSSFKYFDDKEKAMIYFDNFKSILFEGDDQEHEEYFEKFFIDKNYKINKIRRINDQRNRMLYLMTK